MQKYKILTDYIPLMKTDEQGKWKSIPPKGEEPGLPPFVSYNELIYRFIKDFYSFCNDHPEYDADNYRNILTELGIGTQPSELEKTNVSRLDDKTVIVMIMCVLRIERFSEGLLLVFLKKGIIVKWLERLKEIDEYTD